MNLLAFFFGAWVGLCAGLFLAACVTGCREEDEMAAYRALQDSARNN